MASHSRHSSADIHNVVVAHMPGYQIDSVVQAGEGLDHLGYEVNGELIVRFSKEPDPARRAALLSHEARLLAAVAGVSPLPVPEPTFTAAEQGYLAYFKIPGVPLLDAPRHQRPDHGTSIAATLGDRPSWPHRQRNDTRPIPCPTGTASPGRRSPTAQHPCTPSPPMS